MISTSNSVADAVPKTGVTSVGEVANTNYRSSLVRVVSAVPPFITSEVFAVNVVKSRCSRSGSTNSARSRECSPIEAGASRWQHSLCS